MAKHLRLAGIVMIVLGALVFGAWVIKPLRVLWSGFLAMPMPLQVGIGVASAGLVILMISLIVETRSDYRTEGDLTVE